MGRDNKRNDGRLYKMTLTEKDVCMIIPTYNRAEELDVTLKTIIKNKNIAGKIVIVDQSKDDKTKKIVEKYKKRIPLEYLYCKIPSTNIAVNIAIKKYRKKYSLILNTADDVDFLEDYLKEMIKIFNGNKKIMAIGGIDLPKEYDFSNIKNKMTNLILKIFFLPFKENHKFRITGPYGHTSSPYVETDIHDAQWIPGFNTCWRNEFYKDYLWPETIGYDVLSDIDSSYRGYKIYGEGSLIITPKCKVNHRYSHSARYIEKKRIFVNHEDHFSYYFMHFNNFKGTLKLIWSLTGILLGNFLRLIFKPNNETLNSLKYNTKAIIYSIKHKEDIRNKKYRTFLNEDLSIKEGL